MKEKEKQTEMMNKCWTSSFTKLLSKSGNAASLTKIVLSRILFKTKREIPFFVMRMSNVPKRFRNKKDAHKKKTNEGNTKLLQKSTVSVLHLGMDEKKSEKNPKQITKW